MDLSAIAYDNWPLAKANFEALKHLRRRQITAADGRVFRVQFNPERKRSTQAVLTAEAIAARPCFLCEKNRPAEQRLIADGRYDVMINPYPIFNPHLTIVLREHTNQHLLGHLADMQHFAEQLPGMAIFFNGAKCGASAPDHMHFQAARIDDIISHGAPYFTVSGERELSELLSDYNTTDEWVNAIMLPNELRVYLRRKQRPSCFAEGRLLISPATVEMAGTIITTREEDFEKITADDIVNIYQEVGIWK